MSENPDAIGAETEAAGPPLAAPESKD